MNWVRIAQVVGIVLAGSGGALLVLGILNGGSIPLGIAGIATAAVGWSLRLWARGAEDRVARRRLRE
jgi:hypothetical protein